MKSFKYMAASAPVILLDTYTFPGSPFKDNHNAEGTSSTTVYSLGAVTANNLANSVLPVPGRPMIKIFSFISFGCCGRVLPRQIDYIFKQHTDISHSA